MQTTSIILDHISRFVPELMVTRHCQSSNKINYTPILWSSEISLLTYSFLSYWLLILFFRTTSLSRFSFIRLYVSYSQPVRGFPLPRKPPLFSWPLIQAIHIISFLNIPTFYTYFCTPLIASFHKRLSLFNYWYRFTRSFSPKFPILLISTELLWISTALLHCFIPLDIAVPSN
jgi:hypothetical protein